MNVRIGARQVIESKRADDRQPSTSKAVLCARQSEGT